jgi:hypothetical protein
MVKHLSFWGSCLVLGLLLNSVIAQSEDQSNQPPAPAAASVTPAAATASSAAASTAPALDGATTASARESIPPGTTITMQNWQQYKQFMPEGMIGLFDGSYVWKMPSDVQMAVGPTVIYPLPKTYMAATEKYSGQVRIVDLPDGALTLANYQGGIPFPNPAEPHIGWKILANLWYRYLPHLIVDTSGDGCSVDSNGTASCKAAQIVDRQLAYNTDPGTPATDPGAAGKFYSEYLMVLEPEQDRYTATLTLSYTDPSRPEDVFLFLPSLRRYQPVSAAARCAPNQGTDSTQEDYRFGFNSDITAAKVDYLGERKILTMMDYKLPPGRFPDNFDMPLGWPTPALGKWQLRDVYVISVSKVPSRASGYCYGKRVMYVDKATYAPIWEDLYDTNMKPWRILALFLQSVEVPGIGMVTDSGASIWAFWDVQHQHSTFFIDPSYGHAFYLNQQSPPEFTDLTRYTSPAGLNLIMR